MQEGLALLETQPRGADRVLRIVADYSVPNVSEKVVQIILSYTDYLNRVVWRKHAGMGNPAPGRPSPGQPFQNMLLREHHA